ncbi:MAG TPA: DNA polymerase III subunit alpha [Acidimicrobiales bacterium]|nr:DNA polymerase III subunit alpha [Acidimicrobiales bacterium]
MSERSFTHLHTHTEFSMLDGAARVGDLVAAAVADGQPALGITDHGNMYGVLDFYKACRDQGVVPIIGTESYMAGESRTERPVRRGRVDDTGGDVEGGQKLYYHLTLLAETVEGYRNLMQLSSAAYLEGYYYKPRVDWELLERHHTGLIATTGCLGGVVLQALLAGDVEGAEKKAARLQDIFGKENLFVELQDHGIADQHRTNPQLIEIARRIDAPLLATNDSHYTHREDAVAHDALLCVQTGALISDTNRFKFEGTEHYLKSAAEMRHLFRDVPEACDNTLLIAERADVQIELGKPSLPEFPVPDHFSGETYEERALAYLRDLTLEGARERYGASLPTEVVERLDYELSVIGNMGFAAYFLVVWDLIRFARESNIRVGPGRGSAAGCCVAYCLKIVDLDPIRYDLLFERFLNPGRKQMPDIDMDFDERYRSDVMRYAAEKYGSDRVAQVITFSTIKARAAVRDAARVLGKPYIVGDRIAKAMPPLVMGRDTPLHACITKTDGHEEGYAAAAELRTMADVDPDAKEVIEVALGLEGLRRQDGIHAAAVVISRDPLTDYLPIQRKPGAGENPEDAPIVTQYEMHGVEDLGLLKMDFLGLRNLSVMERALDLIEAETGARPDIDGVDLTDEPTLEMLRRAESIGVFQLEGVAMRQTLRALAPTSFDDVAALVALYRPGPMAANMHRDYPELKNGRKELTYLHPDIEPILKDTYGLMLYQESVMRVAQKFAGYSLEEADNLRKACGKKIRKLIAAEREKFVAGCIAEGYGEELGTQLFDIIEPFADYAFNKSHSYGYGLVAYQTAWLKAHYPVEYMSALLTSVKDNKDKTAVYLAECRSMGIEVLVPDVNRSLAEFAPDISVAEDGTRRPEQSIVFGLAAVRNVGESLVERIVAERSANGAFEDVFDFCARVDPVVLNKRTMESLVKGGAFDSFGHPRQGLCLVLESIVDRTIERRKEQDLGITSLFAAFEDEQADPGWGGVKVTIPDTEFDKAQRLAFEKEMLGLYVSDHPLMGYEAAMARHTDCTLSDMREDDTAVGDRAPVRSVGGVVTELKRSYTKKGDLMARFVLEDLQAAMEVFVFPKTMAEYGALIENDAILVVRGRLDTREEEPKIVCMEVSRPILERGQEDLHIALPLGVLTDAKVDGLKDVLSGHPGPSPVLLHVGSKVLQLPPEFNVDCRNGLVGELKRLLGQSAVLS